MGERFLELALKIKDSLEETNRTERRTHRRIFFFCEL